MKSARKYLEHVFVPELFEELELQQSFLVSHAELAVIGVSCAENVIRFHQNYSVVDATCHLSNF